MQLMKPARARTRGRFGLSVRSLLDLDAPPADQRRPGRPDQPLTCRCRQHAPHLGEDRADAGADPGQQSACRHCYETRQQGVFHQVLPSPIPPKAPPPEGFDHPLHSPCLLMKIRFSGVATGAPRSRCRGRSPIDRTGRLAELRVIPLPTVAARKRLLSRDRRERSRRRFTRQLLQLGTG